MIAWYHRQFVEVGDTMFKEEFPSEEYYTEFLKEEENGSAAVLSNRLRNNMVEYFTGRFRCYI